MRRGALFTGCRLSDHPNIAVRVRTMGLVSLNERALGLHVINLEVEYGEVEVTLETSFEGLGLGLLSERIEQDLGVWRTRNSNKRLAIAAAPCLQIDGFELAPTMSSPFVWSWHWKTRTGQIVCLSRLVAVARSDSQDEAPDRAAWQKLESAQQLGWRKLVQEHEAAWSHVSRGPASRTRTARQLSAPCPICVFGQRGSPACRDFRDLRRGAGGSQDF